MGFTDDFNAAVDPVLLNALGDPVIWTPQGGSAVALQAIAEAPFIPYEDGGVPVVAAMPQVTVRDADVPNVAVNDRVNWNSKDYDIIEIQASGDGVSILLLEDVY